MSKNKTIITCALTGVLTDPVKHPVPVTAKEMAQAAREAYDAGATVVHCHFRQQEDGKRHLPSWDPEVCGEIVEAIRAAVPGLVINCSTGVIGPDISGPEAVLRRVKAEMAAMNSGSLNYLKVRSDGRWAWPPMLFDNPVEKIEKFLGVMKETNTLPEFECFDTGILRSISMFRRAGLFAGKPFVSLVMGVASGMPAKPEWLPLLKAEMEDDFHWQVIAIGRQEVWPLLEKAVELGGDIRTGLEDTFYLPSGEKTFSNGVLVEAAAQMVRRLGGEVSSLVETRRDLGV
ncbi:MAG: 3-keto-5-aminohexanoate cleavage protein [Bdellovibrionales bacterium]|nr:3-keto-5-aminohexanoate cleavage protein [Bdellovibrionales bacterium]